MTFFNSLLFIAFMTTPSLAVNENKDFAEIHAIEGAWTHSNEDHINSMLIKDGFWAKTTYLLETKIFIETRGGTWSVEDDIFEFIYEFSSNDSSLVGQSQASIFEIYGNTLLFEGSGKEWVRRDNSQEIPLAGAWFITGRMRDGVLQQRNPGPRKTMKILSDTRFQWIAYNTATKQFHGTGGGSYSISSNDYVEHIEFFSRDSARVGTNSAFQYEIKDEKWHHKGINSRGNEFYEIWSRPSLN